VRRETRGRLVFPYESVLLAAKRMMFARSRARIKQNSCPISSYNNLGRQPTAAVLE